MVDNVQRLERKWQKCIDATQIQKTFLFHHVGGTAVKFRGSQLIKTIQNKYHSENSYWLSFGEYGYSIVRNNGTVWNKRTPWKNWQKE